jgi:hypothetical protein
MEPFAVHDRGVAKLCIFAASTAACYGFWWLADCFGADFFTAFMISGVGALVGCWIGWKLYLRFFNN